MSVEAVIDEVIMEPGKIQPIIVNFQNGQLIDTEARKMKAGVFYDEKTKKTLVAMSNGQMVYRGHRPDPEKELTYTMLAIHNKRTGKVRLVQAERWQVAPVLDREPDRCDELDGNRLMMLNRTFGSQKVKRRTEQYERMKVNVETVQEQLEQTVSRVEIDREDLTTKSEEHSIPDMPQCNRDAAVVEDVYNIYEIIPKELLQELQSHVDEIRALERTSKFYNRTLNIVKESPQTDKKIAILEFVNSVATWLNAPIKDAKKISKNICPVSREVSQYILDAYSVRSSSGRLRPTSIRDKGLLHCLILTLMISNFKLDLELFTTLVTGRVGLKKLLELSRIIGAVPMKTDKKIIVLKVPLPAPTSFIPRMKTKSQKL